MYERYYSEGASPLLTTRQSCAYARRRPRTSIAIPEALQAKVGTLSLEAQSKLEADSAKKEAKAEAKAEAALKKKLVSYTSIREAGTRIVIHCFPSGITSACSHADGFMSCLTSAGHDQANRAQ